MQIPISAFRGDEGYNNTFMHHFLLDAVSHHEKKSKGFIERLADKKEICVQLIIDGEEVNFTETLEFYWSQMDVMIKARAIKLIENELNTHIDEISTILNECNLSIREKLGINED